MNLNNFKEKVVLIGNVGAGIGNLLVPLSINPKQVRFEFDARSAIKNIDSTTPSLALVSIEPPEMHGLQTIDTLRKSGLPIAIIAASAATCPSISASAIRSGATDFLELPCAWENIKDRIENSMDKIRAESNDHIFDHPIYNDKNSSFIGASKPMVEVSKLIINAAKSNASVFITGENGTGKEICAQLIHQLSDRNENSIIPLNCAAIPKGLAESEVFGHIKGSFTGAVDDRLGVASLADGGTLFLDEIGEMELDLQSKLLRFLQTRQFNRVGSSTQEQVDVRLIAATNRDPLQQIEQRTFRQDLFYRLNVIQIHLPPLRERGQDILTLAKQFLTSFSEMENKRFANFSIEAEKLLLSYSWPGNVRELQNIIRSITILHDDTTVIPSMLPMSIINEKGDRRRKEDSEYNVTNIASYQARSDQIKSNNNDMFSSPSDEATHMTSLDDIIKSTIDKTIDHCDGNVVEAAKILGISPSTLYRKIKN